METCKSQISTPTPILAAFSNISGRPKDIKQISRSFYLGFIIMDIYNLISIRVCIIFLVRDWNQYSFNLHYLLAVEIPNCTTPYFEGRRNQTYVVNIIYALDTQTNLKIHISEMGMIQISLTQ